MWSTLDNPFITMVNDDKLTKLGCGDRLAEQTIFLMSLVPHLAAKGGAQDVKNSTFQIYSGRIFEPQFPSP